MLKIIGIILLLAMIYFAWEIHRAPMMPDDYEEDITNVIKTKENKVETDHTVQ